MARPSGFGALLVIVAGAWLFLQATVGELVDVLESYLTGKEPKHSAGQAAAFVPLAGKKKRRQFVAIIRRQLGLEYEWGGTTKKGGFDCSGIIYFAMGRLGHTDFPRTSADQIAHAKKTSIGRAARTAGAVLYFPGHIAVSAGNGIDTYEARGEAYGVVKGPIAGRNWTRGGIFPELA